MRHVTSNRMSFRVLPDRGEVLCTRGKYAPANKGILEWKYSSPDARPYTKLHWKPTLRCRVTYVAVCVKACCFYCVTYGIDYCTACECCSAHHVNLQRLSLQNALRNFCDCPVRDSFSLDVRSNFCLSEDSSVSDFDCNVYWSVMAFSSTVESLFWERCSKSQRCREYDCCYE